MRYPFIELLQARNFNLCPEIIQGYWIKHLKSLHDRIGNHLNECKIQASVPEWMTEGRTTLIMKDSTKGIAVQNYRPITCLNLLWKLLTSIFAEKTYKHLLQNELLPVEQKGCRKDSKGTKDQLIIDKMVMKNCKRRKTSLCMAWIDFKKAYDMVPHSWIVESLRMFGIAENLIHLLSINMAKWKTNLMANKKSLGSVAVKRGIFKGDSFSPLLFVIALIPISTALRKINMGYKLANKQTVEWRSHIADGSNSIMTEICSVFDQLLCLGACRQSSVIAKTDIFL